MTPKELWIDALRYGNYKQGILRLNYKNEKFCCLGVACEVYRQYNDNCDIGIDEEGYVSYNGEGTYLPTDVRRWLGLSTDDGEFGKNCLSTLNDTGSTFDEIADIIESNPEGLFYE